MTHDELTQAVRDSLDGPRQPWRYLPAPAACDRGTVRCRINHQWFVECERPVGALSAARLDALQSFTGRPSDPPGAVE